MMTHRFLPKIYQQDNKYTEGISKHLDSELLNLNLFGGNTHTEEIQAKEKSINTSCSDMATAVTVEEKIMGNLLIKSENNNKYGYMKRYIITSMTQGHNHYPNRKASTYTSTSLNVPITRMSQQPCATGPPRVCHFINVPPLSMGFK